MTLIHNFNRQGKQILRDPILKWFIVLPLAIVLLLRFLIPLIKTLLNDFNLYNLEEIYPLLTAAIAFMLVPLLYGVVIGLNLLDEKDEGIFRLVQVTPLSISNYLLQKFLFGMGFSIIFAFAAIPILALTKVLWIMILPVAILSAFSAPLFALTFISIARNKVEGFAIMKFINLVNVLPVVAYFVQDSLQFLFWIVPTYWPIKAFLLVEKQSEMALLYCLIGSIYQVFLIYLLLRLNFKRLAQA